MLENETFTEEGPVGRPAVLEARIICEGRCNRGAVGRFDESVRRGVPDLAFGRTLQHTPHVYHRSNVDFREGRLQTRRHLFRCLVCDCVRLYGIEGGEPADEEARKAEERRAWR